MDCSTTSPSHPLESSDRNSSLCTHCSFRCRHSSSVDSTEPLRRRTHVRLWAYGLLLCSNAIPRLTERTLRLHARLKTASLSSSVVQFPASQPAMRTPSLRPLLVGFLLMESFALGQGTGAKSADGSHLNRSVPDLCDSFVADNSLIVTSQIEEEIKASRTSFQTLVDCLQEGGALRFDTLSFSPSETIRIEKSISVSSVAEQKLAVACDGRPVFDIRSDLYRRPQS